MIAAVKNHGVEHAQWDNAMRALGFVWTDNVAAYMRRYPDSAPDLQVLGGFDRTNADSRPEDKGRWIARALTGKDGLLWSDPSRPRFDDPVTAAQFLLIEVENGTL